MSRNASVPILLWFRNDLRLADHAALSAAVATGRPVLPVYVLDDAEPGRWALGGASRWWLHGSLTSLSESLQKAGAPLVLRRGATVAEITLLCREAGADAVYAGAAVESWARRLEQALAASLRADGLALRLHRTVALFDQDALRTQSGHAFGVYTPFARACFASATELPKPLPAPRRINAADVAKSDPLESWKLLPRHPDWAGALRAAWQPGEPHAQARLHRLLTKSLSRYAGFRDHPAENATSLLSPHLHWGEISPNQVWHAVRASGDGCGADKFLHELLWREFSIHLLWHHPTMPDQPLRSAFADLAWRRDPKALRAWQRGLTGIPIVDAAMRQLWQIGWMHNRARLIAASFLVKHLLIAWQEGEAWFWDTLVDADLANNSASWQWVAGTGADAAPYFRVFNPVLQSRKFDPEGAYIRRFVPELAKLDATHIHAPRDAPELVLRAAGVILGETYPLPIVDLAEGRARALAAFGAVHADRT